MSEHSNDEKSSWDRRVALGKFTEKEPSTTRRSQEPQEPQERQLQKPKGWYSRGYLPHFDAPGLIQHVTFHLADSLPRDAIDRMERELEFVPGRQRTVERRKRIQALLDSGMGSCILRQGDCARIVEGSLFFGDTSRYRLLAWVVMPSHVHVLIEQFPSWPLSKVVQSWKRHTSREIRLLPTLGSPSCTRQSATPLWQRDYWDRFIRNERHFLTARLYVENNPVAAGLIPRAEAWPWGSARFVEKPSATRRSQEKTQCNSAIAGKAECNSAIPGRTPEV